MRILAIFFSPRGSLPACTWALAFAAQTLAVWLLTRPLARAAGVADPGNSLSAIVLAFVALAILWSIVATTLKRLSAKSLSRWHMLWVTGLWLSAAFFGGRGDPVALTLTVANLLVILWLAWPELWRPAFREPA